MSSLTAVVALLQPLQVNVVVIEGLEVEELETEGDDVEWLVSGCRAEWSNEVNILDCATGQEHLSEERCWFV